MDGSVDWSGQLCGGELGVNENPTNPKIKMLFLLQLFYAFDFKFGCWERQSMKDEASFE